ncbi:MAG: hypothetical protein ABF285_12990 [Pacificibacter sp.]|uniref:hypothetical protein n=1 Tax=Pacificibacter sp. TaxID=1917866 RepID=UPI003219E560
MSLSISGETALSQAMRLLKPILAFVFAAVIIATSGAMASARGMARDASGEMVLCVGTGSVTVLMDADGQPLGVAHFCPDCALASLAVVATDEAVVQPSFSAKTLPVTPVQIAQAPVDGVFTTARGPPVF